MTPGTVDHQGILSKGFFGQDYWSGFSFLPIGDLPVAGIEPVSSASPALQVDSEPLQKPQIHSIIYNKNNIHSVE